MIAALDDSPRPGKAPDITADAKAWLVSLACQKAKDLGYPHELWTTRLLARHVREHAVAAGHPCMANIAQGVTMAATRRVIAAALPAADPRREPTSARRFAIYGRYAVGGAVGDAA